MKKLTIGHLLLALLLPAAGVSQVAGGPISGGGGGGGGTGDVVGPASAVDNTFVRFDAATGKLVQSSNLTCSDVSGVTTTLATITPAATTGATVAGQSLAITASPAVASTDTAGAAAGGSITLTAGAAARNTSGNANGGDINLTPGAGIGTGLAGAVVVPDARSLLFAGTDGFKRMSYGSVGVVNSAGTFVNLQTLGADWYDAVGGNRHVSIYAGGATWGGIGIRSNTQIHWGNVTSNTSGEDTGLGRSAAGVIKCTDSSTGTRCLLGGGTAIASATTLPVPTGGVQHVTGNTTPITSITSTNLQSGVCVTLIFDDIVTLTDGSNLKMAGDFVTTADDTWSGCFDGTNWYETARSVN